MEEENQSIEKKRENKKGEKDQKLYQDTEDLMFSASNFKKASKYINQSDDRSK